MDCGWTSFSDYELFLHNRNILQYLKRINPCCKNSGKLLSYHAISSPREGKIQFEIIPFIKKQRDFPKKNVFTNGDPFIANNSERVIQFEID